MSLQTPPNLIIIKQCVFDACGYTYTPPIIESESAEYDACIFKLNGLHIKFRSAKITPTKTGQFVTLWKRSGKGPIEPFDLQDELDLVIISCRDADKLGCFIFPKSAFLNHGVLATNGKGGKRAIRVYPPWAETNSKQAQKSQQWQLSYFLEIPSTEPVDTLIAKRLFESR